MATTSVEDDWVIRLKGNGPQRDEAIEELRRILVRGLTASLSPRYGGGVQAEDVAQMALMKILATIDGFQGRSRFTTWAMTIATRIGISELRRKHFRDVSLDSLGVDGELKIDVPAAEDSAVEKRLDQALLLQKLKELVETELSGRQKHAIEALLKGVPVEEIARKTNSNRNAVYKLIHDARVRLRTKFADAGIDATDIESAFA